jgi:hypothetical protein
MVCTYCAHCSLQQQRTKEKWFEPNDAAIAVQCGNCKNRMCADCLRTFVVAIQAKLKTQTFPWLSAVAQLERHADVLVTSKEDGCPSCNIPSCVCVCVCVCVCQALPIIGEYYCMKLVSKPK